MKFDNYLLNENMVDSAKLLLKRMDIRKTKSYLQQEFSGFVDQVITLGLEDEVLTLINKGFGTKYRTMKEIQKQKIRESDESLNEDIGHWWDVVKSEAFPTLAFYPALSVWLEIDKLFKDQDMDMKKTIVYSLFWVLLVSGKYVKGWMMWKKQNPDEYNMEKSNGKGGLV